MATGTADSVLALLPRAYNIKKLPAGIPDRPEFDPEGEPHKPHHLMLKVPAANLNVSGPDEVLLPIPPPSSDTEVYRISLTGLSSSTGRVTYSGFERVSPVFKTLRPEAVVSPSSSAITGSAALARMTLGPGWTLSVPSSESRMGEVARLVCTSGTGGPNCSPQMAPGSSRPFATAVQADAPPANGAVAIEITSIGGTTPTFRLPLQPDSSGAIRIKVLNEPLDEMYGGSPMVYAMHHFKLFYLMAQTIQGPYYYPHLAPHASPSPTGTPSPAPESDPFCTPLAQFVP